MSAAGGIPPGVLKSGVDGAVTLWVFQPVMDETGIDQLLLHPIKFSATVEDHPGAFRGPTAVPALGAR